MSRAAEGEWERGTVGQDVALLFAEDPRIRDVLKDAVDITYRTNIDEAWILFCIYLHFFDQDAMDVLMAKLPTYPEFQRHPAFQAVVEHIQENGYLAIAS